MDCVSFESCGEEGLREVPLMVSSCQGPTEKGSPASQALDLVEWGFKNGVSRFLKWKYLRITEVALSAPGMKLSSAICSSPLCSVFGRPLLSGGSSGLGVYHGHEAMGDIEPLRVVSADSIE